jgi:hypothetical protein
VAEIRKLGGSVYYDFGALAANPTEAKSWVPSWIISRTGPDLFHNVISARIDRREAGDLWGLNACSKYDLAARKPWDRGQVLADVRRQLGAFPRLRHLDLYVWPEVSEQCLAAVSELTNLKTLSFIYATDAGVAHLASEKQLQILTLHDSTLTDESLKIFGKLVQLERLQAAGNHFTDDGLAHLRNLKHLVSLDIDCGQTRFTDAGLVHLESLRGLQSLYLQQTLVTPAGVAHLQRILPALQDIILSSPPTPPARLDGTDPFAAD